MQRHGLRIGRDDKTAVRPILLSVVAETETGKQRGVCVRVPTRQTRGKSGAEENKDVQRAGMFGLELGWEAGV